MAVVGSSSGMIELEIPSQPEYVSTARMLVAAAARQHGFGDEQAEDLKIAVSEAVTNAIRAHAAAEVTAPVTVIVTLSEEGLAFEVLDVGAGFDVDQPVDLERTPAPGELEGGLGLSLVRALFSDTSIVRRDASGMRLRVFAKLEAEQAAS